VTAPIGVNNLAFGTLSNATVDGFANQDSTVGGPVTTDGDNGVVSGTIAAVQGALPIGVNNTAAGVPVALPAQVDGTAAAWGGKATANTVNTVLAEAGTTESVLRGAPESGRT
jgi:hypothetical protein